MRPVIEEVVGAVGREGGDAALECRSTADPVPVVSFNRANESQLYPPGASVNILGCLFEKYGT